MYLSIADFYKTDTSSFKRYRHHLRSWHVLHEFIAPMEDSQENVNILACLLALEIQSASPRTIIITRLHSRLASMRTRLEFEGVIKYAVN